MASAAGILRGRLALITGASSGIGKAVSQAFAAQGARVAAVDVTEKVHESVKELTTSDVAHKGFLVDVSKLQSVEELFKEVKKEFQQTPTLIVNCAGITRDQLMIKMTESQFDEVVNVNLKGTFLITQAASRAMMAEKVKNGSIVNISSISGKTGNISQCNYSASKAGVMGFTKSAARELAKFGIRCNAVLPGFVDTPMIQVIPAKLLEPITSLIPLGRVGKPSEIADTCVYLASDSSSYITGACIEVTGGLFM